MSSIPTDETLFRGAVLRLAPYSKEDAATIAHWSESAAYLRLVDTDAARPLSAEQVAERFGQPGATSYYFHLRLLDDDRLIGFVVLHSIEWNNAAGILSIGIGDPADWGKGYGAEALRLILRYAFDELNLHRVGLDVVETNQRAVRAYEKAGFRREGTWRQAVHRDGQRHDRILMGILRHEWQAQSVISDQ